MVTKVYRKKSIILDQLRRCREKTSQGFHWCSRRRCRGITQFRHFLPPHLPTLPTQFPSSKCAQNLNLGNVYHSSHLIEFEDSPRSHHVDSFSAPISLSNCSTKCRNHALPHSTVTFAALSPFDPFPPPPSFYFSCSTGWVLRFAVLKMVYLQ